MPRSRFVSTTRSWCESPAPQSMRGHSLSCNSWSKNWSAPGTEHMRIYYAWHERVAQADLAAAARWKAPWTVSSPKVSFRISARATRRPTAAWQQTALHLENSAGFAVEGFSPVCALWRRTYSTVPCSSRRSSLINSTNRLSESFSAESLGQ